MATRIRAKEKPRRVELCIARRKLLNLSAEGKTPLERCFKLPKRANRR